MIANLRSSSVKELLSLFADILDELNTRGILKTQNNPVADYTEWLVARALDLKLERNSREGFDAIDLVGQKYQIKGRRLHPGNPSRQLSVIRKLDRKEFDFLVAVLYNRDFSLLEGWKIPIEWVEKYARFSKHQNGHILMAEGDVLKVTETKSILGDLERALRNQV